MTTWQSPGDLCRVLRSRIHWLLRREEFNHRHTHRLRCGQGKRAPEPLLRGRVFAGQNIQHNYVVRKLSLHFSRVGPKYPQPLFFSLMPQAPTTKRMRPSHTACSTVWGDVMTSASKQRALWLLRYLCSSA